MATDTLARVLALSAGSGGGGGSDVVVVTADAVINYGGSSGPYITNQSKSAEEIAAAIIAGKDVVLRLNATVMYEEMEISQVINCKVECEYDYIDGETVLPFITYSGIVAVGLPEASEFKEFRGYGYTYDGDDDWGNISYGPMYNPNYVKAGQIGVEDTAYNTTYYYMQVRSSMPASPLDNTLYFITE